MNQIKDSVNKSELYYYVDACNRFVTVKDSDTLFFIEISYYIDDQSFSHHFGTEYIYDACVDSFWIKNPNEDIISEEEDYKYKYSDDDEILVTKKYLEELIDSAYEIFEEIDISELKKEEEYNDDYE